MKELFNIIKVSNISLKKYCFMYIWCLYCAISYTFCALMLPNIVGAVIDNGIAHNDFFMVLEEAAYILILGVLMIVFQYLQKISFAKLSQNITIAIQTKLIEKLSKTNYAFWKHHKAGDVYAVIEKDVNKLERFLSSVMNDAIISILVAGGVAVYLIYIDRTIGVTIIVLALLFSIIQRKIGELAKKEMIILRSILGKLSSFTNNIVNNVLSIRLVGITRKILYDYSESINAYRNQYVKQIKILNIVQATGMAFNTVGLFIIMLLGSLKVFNNELSVGVLFSLTIYLQRLYSPLIGLGSLYVSLRSIVPIINKLLDILENNKEVKSGSYFPTSPLSGEFVIRNVNFRYENDSEYVLSNLNLKVVQGEIIGIVGKNGSGKTSIIRLLSRICTVESGEVLLDGMDINLYDDTYLNNNIGIMSQDNYLPDWKLRELFECDDDKKISSLMEYLNLPLENFLYGLDSKIGENKIALSGGEIQKIAFIRLILQDKQIYIMDEPTSALDTDSEERMIQLINTSLKGKTCVIVTHRKSVLKICNRVLEL